MTEAEWSTCEDPQLMARFLDGKISARKARLLICACCRLLHWRELSDPSSRNAVEMAEQCADGLAGPEALAFARSAAITALQMATGACDRTANPYRPPDHYYGRARAVYGAAGALLSVFDRTEINASARAAQRSVDAANCAVACTDTVPSLPLDRFTIPAWRELFGNPFEPPPLPGSFSSETVTLAKEQYNGKDRREQLKTALHDSPFADWAVHFRTSFHPKGCWALDAMLGLG